jgi:hypothetical protein
MWVKFNYNCWRLFLKNDFHARELDNTILPNPKCCIFKILQWRTEEIIFTNFGWNIEDTPSLKMLKNLHRWYGTCILNKAVYKQEYEVSTQTCFTKEICYTKIKKKTPWSESASELYRPSDRRMSAKWLPTCVDRRRHVVSMTDPSGHISRFSRQEPLLFYQVAPQFVLTRLSAPCSRPTTFFFW